MEIGAQTYSVHERTQTLDGLADALTQIAQIGYRSVQISGTCPYEPEWLRDHLQENQLTCVLTHINPQRLAEDTENVVREHAIFGCKNIGIGALPQPMQGSLEGYEEFRRIYLPVALKLRDLGVKLHYHNHWFEFDKLEGKDLLQRILEDFPADSIDFTLDLGWADFAGADVLQLIDTLKGRLSRVHLKDYADKPEDGSITTIAYLRPIFEGKLPYEIFIPALKKAGCEYALVEQDYSYGEDPFDCLRRSYQHIFDRFDEKDLL